MSDNWPTESDMRLFHKIWIGDRPWLAPWDEIPDDHKERMRTALRSVSWPKRKHSITTLDAAIAAAGVGIVGSLAILAIRMFGGM